MKYIIESKKISTFFELFIIYCIKFIGKLVIEGSNNITYISAQKEKTFC